VLDFVGVERLEIVHHQVVDVGADQTPPTNGVETRHYLLTLLAGCFLRLWVASYRLVVMLMMSLVVMSFEEGIASSLVTPISQRARRGY
jgi:hypothetical protein